jgi:DNA-binding NtrC family response regulator
VRSAALANTILVVDDEPAVLRFSQAVLSKAGFQTLTARDGVDGLAVYRAHKAEICLILSDCIMPRMNGIEMAEEIKREDAEAKILLITAHWDAAMSRDGSARFPYLIKPFRPADLVVGAKDALPLGLRARSSSRRTSPSISADRGYWSLQLL